MSILEKLKKAGLTPTPIKNDSGYITHILNTPSSKEGVVVEIMFIVVGEDYRGNDDYYYTLRIRDLKDDEDAPGYKHMFEIRDSNDMRLGKGNQYVSEQTDLTRMKIEGLLFLIEAGFREGAFPNTINQLEILNTKLAEALNWDDHELDNLGFLEGLLNEIIGDNPMDNPMRIMTEKEKANHWKFTEASIAKFEALPHEEKMKILDAEIEHAFGGAYKASDKQIEAEQERGIYYVNEDNEKKIPCEEQQSFRLTRNFLMVQMSLEDESVGAPSEFGDLRCYKISFCLFEERLSADGRHAQMPSGTANMTITARADEASENCLIEVERGDGTEVDEIDGTFNDCFRKGLLMLKTMVKRDG